MSYSVSHMQNEVHDTWSTEHPFVQGNEAQLVPCKASHLLVKGVGNLVGVKRVVFHGLDHHHHYMPVSVSCHHLDHVVLQLFYHTHKKPHQDTLDPVDHIHTHTHKKPHQYITPLVGSE